MLQQLKNWWNKDKIAQQALDEKFRALTERLDEIVTERDAIKAEKQKVVAELETVKEEVGVFRQQAAEDEARRNSPEPWVEIKSESVDPVKGIQIELDWNEAFIQYLKDAGLKARDEETIVQKWLAFLYQDLIEKLEKQVIDNSDKPRVNDFE
jgi:predicted nuclease with TOPRIM domain